MKILMQNFTRMVEGVEETTAILKLRFDKIFSREVQELKNRLQSCCRTFNASNFRIGWKNSSICDRKADLQIAARRIKKNSSMLVKLA